MNKFLVGVAAVAVLALVLSGFALSKPGQVIVREVKEVLGRGVSQDHLEPEFFHAGAFLAGQADPDGAIPTLTGAAAASSTITASSSMVCTNNVIISNFPTATGTLTWPGAGDYMSDGRCLAKVGDFKVFFVENQNDLVGTTTFRGAASSSINFLALATAANASSTLISSSTAKITALRMTSSSQPWIKYLIENFR